MSTVRFYDFENRRVIDIPAAELAPGSVKVQLNGSDEVVWMEARHLKPTSKPRHQSLSPELNEAIRRIKDCFQEQNPMAFEEWEEGFRFDAHPEKEIAYWLRAAVVFRHHAQHETDPEIRAEIYSLVGCCLNANRENVLRIFDGKKLGPQKAQAIIESFYGNP